MVRVLPHPNLTHLMSTLLLTRIALACAAAVLAASALAYRRRTLALLREFFAAESHPLNLAVTRVTASPCG